MTKKPKLTDKEFDLVCRIIQSAGGDASVKIPESDEDKTKAMRKLMDTADIPKLV